MAILIIVSMFIGPFHLDSLLDSIDPKTLEDFSDKSKIRRQMLDGELEPGQQIWIYHDKETNCLNCVARVNPYAHVAIYAQWCSISLSNSQRQNITCVTGYSFIH